MSHEEDVSVRRRFFSIAATAVLVISTLLIGISIQVPKTTAASVSHNNSNLKIYGLNDRGSIRSPIQWKGTYQSTIDLSAITLIGLVIDQDNYNHTPGSIDIADCFSAYSYSGEDDFKRQIPAQMYDDGTVQKSTAAYQNEGTDDPFDIYVNQTAWSVKNKDWFIIQYRLINIKGSDITGVSIGLELSLSKESVGVGGGVGGDSGDDVDGYDPANAVYYVQDNGGAGTCFGFGSAFVSDPITHYYSANYTAPYHNVSWTQDPDPKYYKNFYANETWLYDRLHMPNTVVGATPGNRTSTVGWDGFDIPAGSSRTVTLVMAINDTFNDMISAIQEAQNFYYYGASGFRITEFSDSDSVPQQIEIYNLGRELTDLSGPEYSLIVNGGTITGTWSNNPLPTYEYAVFTRNGGASINAEGDTIQLYENGVLIDEVSFGQEGPAPDPLSGESVARRFDSSRAEYVNEWLRNAASGPTWGSQNNVGSVVLAPDLVLNRVMFYPINAVEGYIELMYTGTGTLDISGYKIVCDTVYVIPPGTILNASNRFFVLKQLDSPPFFTPMTPSGDNVYLYNSNGDLLDMVGWSSSHTQGYFMTRDPDGSGTYQGYHDVSSLAAGWVFDRLPNLLITEFSVDDANTAQIEVLKPRGGDIVLGSDWGFSVDLGQMTGTWNDDPLSGGAYTWWNRTAGNTFDPQGDTIRLEHLASELIDVVSFGIKGVAPDPVIGESTGRYWDDAIPGYTDIWNRNASTGPTWGSQNDVPPINPAPEIVLNEVMFNPTIPPDGRFLVIMNTNLTTAIDITGYYIICNDIFQFPSIQLNPYNLLIITYANTQYIFDTMLTSKDNVYLYDNNGELLDMVGWNSPHLQGNTVRRIPDGNGTYQGYHDVSSEAAGWVFDNPLDVLITEISDSGSATSQIEVYNPWYPTINFGSIFEFHSDSYTPLAGSWSVQYADSGEHAVFNVSAGTPLGTEGDTIGLYQNGVLREEIAYGLRGTIPDPLSDESVARYWNGAQYTDDWSRNWTLGPTFGTQNDVPAHNTGTGVVLNEIMFNPTLQADGYVELYYKFGFFVDISGFKIVCDTEFIIPPGTFLLPDDRYFYLTQPDNDTFFSALDSTGDNVYLYDDAGSFLDEAGWSSPHTPDLTMCRIPDGAGTPDGFNDTSSVVAGWVFDCNASIQLVKIATGRGTDEYMSGPFNGSIVFNLTISNKQNVEDTVSISYININGYPVRIFDETGSFQISKLTLAPGETINITVNVTLPSILPFIDWDNITITIQSENVTLIRDTIILQAVVVPFIMPDKWVTPQQIYYNGTGYNETATITLNITGMGHPMELSQPQDVVFCVDVSGSMTLQSIDLAKQGLTDYVDEMDLPDAGAVVVFGLDVAGDPYTVELLNPLSTNYTQLKQDIASIPGPQGMTPMGEAMEVAIDELLANGSSAHLQVIILLTDGVHNGFVSPENQALRAAANNITIFTIGLGSGVDEARLQAIANTTGGLYFWTDDASLLPEIYRIISAYIGSLAGRDPDTSDSTPMVRDVLPPWIDYVPGSFSIAPATNYTNATNHTILEWNITGLEIGESWEVTFLVKANELGWVYANDYNSSRVYFMDYFDNEFLLPFPETKLLVLAPPPSQPELYINTSWDGEDAVLTWDPPTTPGIHHYLIYRSTSQTDFDFSSPWINTNTGFDNGIIPLRTSWNDTRAALPGDPNYEVEYYYVIRSVNDLGEMSLTSRTVGKLTKTFQAGISTFSLPLEPIDPLYTDYYTTNMPANYIRYMDPATHVWIQHNLGDGNTNNILMKLGEGFEVEFNSQTTYTFCGLPGAMISYDDDSGFAGFDWNVEAKSLTVSIQGNGDVDLSWTQPGSMADGWFEVYYSNSRDGFFGMLNSDYFLACPAVNFGTTIATHNGALALDPGTRLYYMVVPFNAGGVRGAGTYSIGIWTEEYLSGYDTFGVPLKLTGDQKADWYCDNIPNTVGINYFDIGVQRWRWHSTMMPQLAFDPYLVMVEGYQISTSALTKYTFIGV